MEQLGVKTLIFNAGTWRPDEISLSAPPMPTVRGPCKAVSCQIGQTPAVSNNRGVERLAAMGLMGPSSGKAYYTPAPSTWPRQEGPKQEGTVMLANVSFLPMDVRTAGGQGVNFIQYPGMPATRWNRATLLLSTGSRCDSGHSPPR